MFPKRFWTLGRCPDSFEPADLILSWTGEESSPRRISAKKESFQVLRTLMATNHSSATAILRLVLGLVFLADNLDSMPVPRTSTKADARHVPKFANHSRCRSS